MRFHNKVLLVISVTMASAPVWGQDDGMSWMVCTVSAESVRLVTTPVRINWSRDINEIQQKFKIYAWKAGLNGEYADCDPFQTLDEITGMHQVDVTYETWDRRTARTALFPGLPKDWHLLPAPEYDPGAASETLQATSAPSAALIVEDTGETARLKAWDDSILQARRSEAEGKVAQAVVSAKLDAEVKSRAAQVLERYRQQGRKQ